MWKKWNAEGESICPDVRVLPRTILNIISRAGVGYEMIDSHRRVGYNHLISNLRKCDNGFIKNSQEILLDLADFALQEQREDNLIVAVSLTWYNGSYTMVAEPIKYLELHYSMTQFLVKTIRQTCL